MNYDLFRLFVPCRQAPPPTIAEHVARLAAEARALRRATALACADTSYRAEREMLIELQRAADAHPEPSTND